MIRSRASLVDDRTDIGRLVCRVAHIVNAFTSGRASATNAS